MLPEASERRENINGFCCSTSLRRRDASLPTPRSREIIAEQSE